MLDPSKKQVWIKKKQKKNNWDPPTHKNVGSPQKKNFNHPKNNFYPPIKKMLDPLQK